MKKQVAMQQQAGFTLIELIAVIVVLGILAATAVPKFVNLSDQAASAAVDGVAGALASGSALNFAAYTSNQANITPAATVTTTTAGCTTAAAGLLQDGLPTGYTVTADAALAAGATTTCTVTGEKSQTADFILHGVN